MVRFESTGSDDARYCELNVSSLQQRSRRLKPESYDYFPEDNLRGDREIGWCAVIRGPLKPSFTKWRKVGDTEFQNIEFIDRRGRCI